MGKGLFRFFSSLKLAVFCLLSLSAVLAVATLYGRWYGMRGSQLAVYQTPWFMGLLFLLALNVLCAALSRYPWKLRQLGFVTTHLGILVLLWGSFMTQQFGIDGNMPVAEKNQENEVILNDLVLSVIDEKSGQKRDFPIPESYQAETGKILNIELGSGNHIQVEKFIPRALPQQRMVSSPQDGVGAPALKIELYNDRFNVEEWLVASQLDRPQEVNLGPAVLSFGKLWNVAQEKEFERVAPPPKKLKDEGKLQIEYQGKNYEFEISAGHGKWTPVQGSPFEIQVVRYLPYAVVENNELVTKSQEPINPATEFVIRKRGSAATPEKHTVFANFPEFATLHGSHGRAEAMLGVNVKMEAPHPEGAPMAGVRGKLSLAVSADGSRLLYKVERASGERLGFGVVEKGKPVPTGWMDLQFVVKEYLPFSVEDSEPKYVAELQGADEPFLTAIRLKILDSKSGNSTLAPDHWFFEGVGKSLSIGGQEVFLHYHKTKLILPFHLFLDKFTVGMNPGTTSAASFVSNVVVKDPAVTEEKSAVISMNEPLVHGGYTFYQASYQMNPGAPPVSVFAVNYDPGRPVKYLGSIIIVLGALLMFYMNPHYIQILLGRKKEAA